MNAIDLFSGAGGLSLGLSQAGIEVVLANEIEHDFAKTHELNHTGTRMLHIDIHKVDFVKELAVQGFKPGEIDLVCGGPPCQGFSTVGKKEFLDPRNSLFGQFLRATDEVNPTYVLFENVAGFKRLYGGKIYEILLEELDARGFSLNFGILNAKD